MTKASEADRLKQITLINIADMITAFKIDRLQPIRGLLDILCYLPARQFSQQLIAYDDEVGKGGLAAGARPLLHIYTDGVRPIGADTIPKQGPVLFLSNHPGISDVLSLFLTIQRPDLRVVALNRNILRLLPNVSDRMIYISSDPSQRTAGVRNVVSYLKQGGAVLTFPAGKIEPDPAVMPDAIDSLANWSESIALLVRRFPSMTVIPLIVSGVVEPRALHNPLATMHKQRKDREWASATLQIFWPSYRHTIVTVRVGTALHGETLATHNSKKIMEIIRTEAAQLIADSRPIHGYPQ